MSTHNKLYVKTELFTPRVDGTDFTTADWAYLGTVNQNMATSDEVEFNTVSLNSGGSFTTKLDTGATANYTITFPTGAGTLGDSLVNQGSGVLAWQSSGGFDQSLNTTDNVQFNNLTLTGNLTVQGTTTLVESTDLKITDNTIIVNKDETGAGVTAGTAGIEVERGTADNAYILYLESVDKWIVGFTSGVVIGTDRFYVTEWSNGTQTQGAIPGIDANGRLTETEGLSATEVDQLQNIDSVTISNTQWGYLGALDQGLTTTSSVQFADLTLNAAGLTVGVSTPTATQWGYLAALDQGLTTSSTVDFAQLTVDQVDINDGKITYSGATGANEIIVPDNLADALSVTDGSETYIQIVSTTAADEVKLLQNTSVTGNLSVTGTVAGLTQAELGELANIDSVTISNTQWGYLGAADQAIATTDTVQFAQVTVDQVVINDGKITYSGTTGNNEVVVPDNLADAWSVTDGTQDYIQVVSTTGSDEVKLLQNTDITGNLTVSGTVAGLTQAELGELANIDSTTISATQWGYLGAADQAIATTDTVQFAQVTVDQVVINDGKITYSGATGANEVVVPDNLADAWSVTDGTQSYIQIVSSTGSDEVKLLQNTDITGNLTVSGTVAGLTQAELGELANIDSVTISNTQWGYLGATDQGLTTTSNVTFNDVTVNGSITLSEPLAKSVSATLTADPNPIAEGINIFDTSLGAIAPTLPVNSTSAGQTFIVYLKTAGNNLTITRAGSDTIEGNTTFVLDTAGQHCSLTSVGDGTWLINA
jgi:SpoU rRNA methylase family enzyme